MSKLYQFSGSLEKVKAFFKDTRFTAIIEGIESVEIKDNVSLNDRFNDFLRARFFNEKYDITVTSSNAVILTEEDGINGISRIEYSVIDSKGLTNFINGNPVVVRKYICKKPGDNITKISDSTYTVNEKLVFYRLTGS
ncbi:MAG: hypothetical protein IBX72_09750 [Nitrospirae bacterium]|nr:hypothetical protein [Nitrospirota bacterium]